MRAPYTELKAKLGESGIRYIRDETFQEVYAPVMDLYHSFGIKINMIFGRGPTGPYGTLNLSNIPAEVDQMKAQALPAVASLEAPNEYDGTADADWAPRIRNYTQILYTLAKADESLKNLPVIGPSLIRTTSYQIVGDLDQYIDHPNMHIYPPYWPGYSDTNETSRASLTFYFNYNRRYQSPSLKTIHATEGGYTNILAGYGVSEEAGGKYIPRIYAEYFRRGIVRTCQYEFADERPEGGEGHFGLIRLNITEKPAFRGVKMLIAVLNDKGPDFKPDSLNYVFDGNINNIRHMLFQKRNGVFYIVVWLEVSSWDVQAKIDLYPLPQEVVLTILANYNAANATIYALDNNGDTNTSAVPIDNFQVRLNVTDKISIIELSNNTQI